MTAALGRRGFADAYNLANTTPNIITDIVIGGVLSATFVPVFVDRPDHPTRQGGLGGHLGGGHGHHRRPCRRHRGLLRPDTRDHPLYTVTNHHADVHQQQRGGHVPAALVRPPAGLLRPHRPVHGAAQHAGQVRRPHVRADRQQPRGDRVLLWFHALVPNPTLVTISAHHSALVLLGIGTTLGVVVQAALLVPSLLRSDLHVRFRWEPAHEAMRTIAHLAGWTFGIVLANQVALVVVLALADGARVPGAVSAYTYAYTFFQLPYGVVAVSVMSAVTPSLSARWAAGDIAGFRHRMAFGLRSILAVIIPSAVGMIILAHPLIDLVLDPRCRDDGRGVAAAAAPGHVRPRPARLLHLPLHGPGAPVHAGHPYRLPDLPDRERRQHRRSASLWSGRSACGAWPCRCRSPTPGRRDRPVGGARSAWAASAATICPRRCSGSGGHRGHGRGHRPGPQRLRCHLRVRDCWPGGVRRGGRCGGLRRDHGGPRGPDEATVGHGAAGDDRRRRCSRHRGGAVPGDPRRTPAGARLVDPAGTAGYDGARRGPGRRRPRRPTRSVADSTTGPTPRCATYAVPEGGRAPVRRAAARRRRPTSQGDGPRRRGDAPWPGSG